MVGFSSSDNDPIGCSSLTVATSTHSLTRDVQSNRLNDEIFQKKEVLLTGELTNKITKDDVDSK